MNQFALLRLIIPTLKTTNKLFQPQSERTSQFFKHLCQFPSLYNMSEKLTSSKSTLSSSNISKSSLEAASDENSEENQQVLVQLAQSHDLLSERRLVRKNYIDKRIKTLQYEANSPCEDSCVFQQLHTIDAYTVSIFDGHGGPELAEYSRSKINNLIDSYLQDYFKKNHNMATKSIGEILKQSLVWSYQKLQDTFFEIYQRQIKMGNKKIKNVGTCGITAIVHNDRVYVGNSGDSQGIFIKKEGVNMLKSEDANKRLSANIKSERERLKEQWEGIDQNIISQQSNNCFYLKGRLQPTRTIGDYYLKKKDYYNGTDTFKGPYLNCKPDVNEHRITQSHKYMVLASDGIWDVLAKDQVMNCLLFEKEIDLNKTCYDMDDNQEAPYLKSVLNNVLDRACEMSGRSLEQLKKMSKGKRRNYHDDITIAVINLQNQI